MPLLSSTAGNSLMDMMRVSRIRKAVLLALDGGIAAAALWVAMLLRFEGTIPPPQRAIVLHLTGLIVCSRILANMLFRLHRWSFRFSGLVDGARIWVAAVFGTGLFVFFTFLGQLKGVPRSVVIMELILSGLTMGVVRFSPRLTSMYVSDQLRSRKQNLVRTLIVGAGSAGELLQRDLGRSDEHSYLVVGFVDDDRDKLGMVVGGKPVLGGIDELPEIARAYRIEEVLIAIPRLEARRIREILSHCSDVKLHFKILPVSFVYLNERGGAAMLQDLQPDDLLPRDPVSFTDSGESPRAMGRVAVVTGAAGSIGSEICRQLLAGGVVRLVMVDMNENGLYLMKRRFERDFPGIEVHAEVADVRDRRRLLAVMKAHGCQDVFHAAAHKHVPLMETAPGEAVKNNILGTKFVTWAADMCGAERFVYISTDKAVRPTSVMGVSKRVGEKIVRWMARRSKTKFCAVRFGNVLGSAGSVVPLFREQIAAGGPVTVTDPEVRRYFMTISEAVGLVLQAAYGDYGELCILEMGEQIPIVNLARHMITMAGKVPDVDIPIVFTGLRPGEKLFEELLTEEEEATSRVTEKICVAACPPVREDLDDWVERLADAAFIEDHGQILRILKDLVPSFQLKQDQLERVAASDSGLPAVLSTVRKTIRRSTDGELDPELPLAAGESSAGE